MSASHDIEISGRGDGRPRRRAARLACALAALTLLGGTATGAATAADPSHRPAPAAAQTQDFSALQALIQALGARRAENAVAAIGRGFALTEAQKRIAATERRIAHKQSAAVAKAEAAEAALAFEEVKDPSEMAPASAGTNGTTVPTHGDDEKLFAHSRQTVDGSTAILLSGIALAPPDAPEAVQNVINAANTIVGRPYVWGGGHASFYSYGYDCSGSVSFALFGGGLIPEPLTSGSLESWGSPGPGKWITVYANAGHTFMEIAGLRWDTVGDARGTGPRWHLAPTDTSGFVVRHPQGL
jgi:cell wall-associated NlpC family hydrolase